MDRVGFAVMFGEEPGMTSHIPSHHDAHSSHVIHLQRFWRFDLSTSVRGLEIVPGNVDQLQVVLFRLVILRRV